jgi:hypothetical protein
MKRKDVSLRKQKDGPRSLQKRVLYVDNAREMQVDTHDGTLACKSARGIDASEREAHVFCEFMLMRFLE